jgi:hypothetical protein
MPDTIRHPGMKGSEKSNGFPFDFAQGGESVEPRIKSGMTKQCQLQIYQLQHTLAGANPEKRTIRRV